MTDAYELNTVDGNSAGLLQGGQYDGDEYVYYDDVVEQTATQREYEEEEAIEDMRTRAMSISELAQHKFVKGVKYLQVGTELREDAIAMPKTVHGKASVNGSVFNLSNSMVGAGVLTLPYGFANTGIVMGFVLLFGVAIMATFSFRTLIKCRNITRLWSYKELAAAAFNPGTAQVVQGIICVMCFGTLIAYCILLADFTVPIFKLFANDTVLTNRTFVIALFAGVTVFPLCLLVNLAPLRFTSLVALIAVLYGILAVIFTYFVTGRVTNDSVQMWPDGANLFVAVPLLSTAFNAHYNILPIYKELDDRKKHLIGRVVNGSMTVCVLLYATMAIFGLLHFGSDITGNVLNGYPDNDPVFVVARVGFAFTIIFSFPLVHFGLRSNFEGLFFANKPQSRMRLSIEAFIFVSLAAVVAILAGDIAIVFGLNGAINVSLIQFIFPGLFYIRLAPGPPFSLHKLPAAAMVGGGFVLGILGVVMTFKNL